jgi:hypothetical protein
MYPNVVICPKRVTLATQRSIFLAGPDRFTARWRDTAIEYLSPRVPDDVLIFSPQRAEENSHMRFDDAMALTQSRWEEDHLDYVRDHAGICLFWLPLRTMNTNGHNYGQRTNFELGLASAFMEMGLIRIVIGAENGYHGIRSTMYTLTRRAPSTTPVTLHTTLKDTCEEALRILTEQ